MNTENQKPNWANWQSENPLMAKQADDCELSFSKLMGEMLEQGIDPAAIMRGCLMAYADLTLNAQPEGLPFTDRMMAEHRRAMDNAFLCADLVMGARVGPLPEDKNDAEWRIAPTSISFTTSRSRERTTTMFFEKIEPK